MTTISQRPSALIRNEPVQARSTARLSALLDATARVVDRIGYERLTTAMVAEGAGASIGTVYRYFPDRIAVLQSLAARNVERVGESLLADAGAAPDARAALDAVYDRIVEAFGSEPGFASLRFGDVIDLRPAEGERADSMLADRLHELLTERYSVATGSEVRLGVQAGLALADALIARAFAATGADRDALLALGRRTLHAVVDPLLG